MALKIDVKEQADGIYVVEPEGRIDTDTDISFKEKVAPVLEMSPKAVIFDMGKVDYVDSTGLAVILHTRKILEEKGGVLLVADLQVRIKNVFEVTRIVPEEYIFENMEGAYGYLGGTPGSE